MLSFPAQRWSSAIGAATGRHPNDLGLKRGCASKILPRLYLSDYYTARDETELARLGITHIVSVLDFDPDTPKSIPESHKLHICIGDSITTDILSHLPDTTRFISEALSESETNKVLVHCFQGVSRSATVVCAYLVATEGMSAVRSIEFAQSKRGIVSPNTGFRRQLMTYGEQFPPLEKKLSRPKSALARLFQSQAAGA